MDKLSKDQLTIQKANINIQDVDLEKNCLTIKSRRTTNKIHFSVYISKILGRYLDERLEMITFYGHDDALFLSLKMKRLSVRSVELLLKKYSSILFGAENNVRPKDMRNAFMKDVFIANKNLFITSELTGNTTGSLLLSYSPYIEDYEAEKGKDFDPEKYRS